MTHLIVQVIESLLGLALTAATGYLAPKVSSFIKTNKVAKKAITNDLLIGLAQESVQFAEKVAREYVGSEQFKAAKNHFIELLQNRGIDLTGAELDSKIEYAYDKAKAEFSAAFKAAEAPETTEPTGAEQTAIEAPTTAQAATVNVAPGAPSSTPGKPSVSVPGSNDFMFANEAKK
jgi:hypothetical protein